MQVTTAKLCCSDVFFRTFVRSPTIISCFNRTARRLIEESQLLSSCSVPCRISSNRLYGHPSISPDLNPVDYAVWGALEQSVYHIPISNLDGLKDSAHLLEESWPTDHLQVHWSVTRDRLKAVVRVNGGHIEYGICLICCHALLCIASLCILWTCVH